jgi:DNA-binding NarL/FixJ family response regulator
LRNELDLKVIGNAANGLCAVKLARKLQPDVVIMDGEMPVLKGVDATRLIMAELPQTRVIGYSLYASAVWVEAMLKAGAYLCLSKRCDPKELLQAIRAHRADPPV